MTFLELQTEIMDRLNYTSSAASTRVGRLINKVYRQVGTAIGMSFSRQAQTSAVVTVGNAEVTFTATEKPLFVWTLSGTTRGILKEVMLGELIESTTGTSDAPTRYAVRRATSNSVTIRLDAIPATAYTLYAEVIAEISDLSGAEAPAFPESFHDVIIEGVLKDEYRKLEKIALARESETAYERRLSDLRMFAVKSNLMLIRQGEYANTNTFGSSSNSGGVSSSAPQQELNDLYAAEIILLGQILA